MESYKFLTEFVQNSCLVSANSPQHTLVYISVKLFVTVRVFFLHRLSDNLICYASQDVVFIFPLLLLHFLVFVFTISWY